MRLHIDQPPCPRDRRVIRRLLVEPDSQKSPQPERIRRSPSDPALRIDSFKIPNQQQPKIDPRHQRGPPVVCGVKLRALPLGERIELSLFQQFIHSLVERMAWPLRQFIVADPQPLLPLSAPSCPHRHRGFSRLRWHSTRTSDLRKLCSAANKQKTDFHHRLLGIFIVVGCFLFGSIFPIVYRLIPSARTVHIFDDFAPFLLYWYIFWKGAKSSN